jgi:hypothetical protein
MRELTSWRELIVAEMADHGESFADVKACTITDGELDERFDAGFGGTEGKPFALWTSARVYFPLSYDGAEWCGSAPRHPSDETLAHQGGG